MYYTHNLRTNLEEWRNRLYRSTYQNFDNNYTFLFAKFEEIPLFKSILTELLSIFKIDEPKLSQFYEDVFQNSRTLLYENEQDAAATCFQFLAYLRHRSITPSTILRNLAPGKYHNEQLENFVENYINPITQYIHDQIDDANSTLYLIEKYKSRVEWFLKGELLRRYKDDNSEDVLEDHLRLFLFDQGIDYPFSTPKSASGRADVVGLLDTENPLVLEIKIYDSPRGYRKKRVIDGFSQIVQYANDYNKSVGYLVVFNLDNVEINVAQQAGNKTYPKSVVFNHKTFFVITINLNQDVTASKLGKLKVITFTLDELTQKVEIVEE